MLLLKKLFPVLLVASLASCSTPYIKRSPSAIQSTFKEVCSLSRKTKTVRGNAWIKVKSQQDSGQFPIIVLAEAPGSLTLEITNLIGAAQAKVQIKDNKFVARWYGSEAVEERGEEDWNGLPLNWAVDLFLGRYPCPASDTALGKIYLKESDRGELIVMHGNDEFTYGFRKWGGKDWVESVQWVRKGKETVGAHFEFDAPEEPTGVPLKWSVHTETGDVKMRWNERSAE